MFKRCDFLMGAGDSIVIVIPDKLPPAENYTVSISDKEIKFRAGYDEIAVIPYSCTDIFRRIANQTQIGLVEYINTDLPSVITAVAYVEVRRSA